VNEKNVLFLDLESGSIVLVDTHCHGMHGAEILLGQAGSLYHFVMECQKLLDMRGQTYGICLSLLRFHVSTLMVICLSLLRFLFNFLLLQPLDHYLELMHV